MLPTSFEEIYIRLYWKGVGKDEKEIDKKRKDILEEAFLDINSKYALIQLKQKRGFDYNCLQNKEFITTCMYLLSY